METLIRHSFLFLLIPLLTFCSPQFNKSTQSTYFQVDVDTEIDPTSERLILPYKTKLEEQMNIVIGQAPDVILKTGNGESALGNLIADLQKEYAKEKLGYKIDISVMNNGGIRNNLPQGNITVGNIFEISPFENFIFILELNASDVKKLAEYVAEKKSIAISGMQVISKDNKLSEYLLNGMQPETGKTYLLAINDYLAGGGQGMDFLTGLPRKAETNFLLRDMLVESIKEKTAKGEKITARIEGRQIHH